jgi:hypothetical protein
LKTIDGAMVLDARLRLALKTKEDTKTKRRYFRTWTTGDILAPLVMLQFAPEDFAQMIPEGATSEEIFYGPTNYAVYLDLEALNLSTAEHKRRRHPRDLRLFGQG